MCLFHNCLHCVVHPLYMYLKLHVYWSHVDMLAWFVDVYGNLFVCAVNQNQHKFLCEKLLLFDLSNKLHDMVRKIFGPKGHKVSGDWWRLRRELHDLYF
jgi:hypothetical protein